MSSGGPAVPLSSESQVHHEKNAQSSNRQMQISSDQILQSSRVTNIQRNENAPLKKRRICEELASQKVQGASTKKKKIDSICKATDFVEDQNSQPVQGCLDQSPASTSEAAPTRICDENSCLRSGIDAEKSRQEGMIPNAPTRAIIPSPMTISKTSNEQRRSNYSTAAQFLSHAVRRLPQSKVEHMLVVSNTDLSRKNIQYEHLMIQQEHEIRKLRQELRD